MTYLKHEPKKRTKKPAQPQAATEPVKVVLTGPATAYGTPSMQHDINHVAGLSGVEESLDLIARYLARLTSDESGVHLTVAQGPNVNPIKITLADDIYEDGPMEQLATALERIADSVAKLAGLNRPRLERWHEQDKYEPRYRDQADDGGAPGPKAA